MTRLGSWLCVVLFTMSACASGGGTPPPEPPPQEAAAPAPATPPVAAPSEAEPPRTPAPKGPASEEDVLALAMQMADAMQRNAGNCDQMGKDLMALVAANEPAAARMRAMRGTQAYRDFKSKYRGEMDVIREKAKSMRPCTSNPDVKQAIDGM